LNGRGRFTPGGLFPMAEPEAWLRGPLDGIDPVLMPAAHALVQAGEDLQQAASDLTVEQLWVTPGGAASPGFHLRHIAGSIDRLLTYARGEQLNEAQRQAILHSCSTSPSTPSATRASSSRRPGSSAVSASDNPDPSTTYPAGRGKRHHRTLRENPGTVRVVAWCRAWYVPRHLS
jgi:hypothetical protein